MNTPSRRARLARWSSLLLAVGLAGVAAAAPAPPPRIELAVQGGQFNLGHRDPTSLYGLELRGQWGGERRLGDHRLRWRPELGLFATSEDARFGYAGLRLDLDFAGGWHVSPGFDVGAYERGDDHELGQTLEFRSSLELGRSFGRRNRLGLTFFHISNAGLSEVNPGANSAALVWSIRLGALPAE